MPGQNLLGGCLGGRTTYDEDDIADGCDCVNGYEDAGETFDGNPLPTTISITGNWSNTVSTTPPSDVYSFSFSHTWNRVDYVEGGTLADDEFWIKSCASCCGNSGPPIYEIQFKSIPKSISITNPDSTLDTNVSLILEILPEYVGYGCAATTFELVFSWGIMAPDPTPPAPSCNLGAVGGGITATGVTAADLLATWDGDPTYDSFTCPVGGNTQSITSSIQVVIS